MNNAAAGRMSTFANTTDAHWHEELDIKFFSVIYPTRAVVPFMRLRGGGRIVNVNAILAASSPVLHLTGLIDSSRVGQDHAALHSTKDQLAMLRTQR